MRWASILAVACIAAAPAMAQLDGGRDEPLVIILSWDGMRHDYLERGDFPALARMEREGLRIERFIPPWPSSTFPAHVTLATGAPAATHGIVDNRFYDRERGHYSYSGDAGWIEAEPLWIAAERQGVTAAIYFWVGSETDWRGERSTYRKAPFDASVPESVKTDRIIEWIDLPGEQRPGLIMSWWRGADRVGHHKGPEHPAVAETIAEQDRELERLLAAIDERGLWPSTTLMVVTDHGMTEIEDFFDLAGFLRRQGFEARLAGGATVKHVFLEDGARAAGELVEALSGEPGLGAHRSEELPEAITLGYPGRKGDVIVIAEPSWILELPPLRTRLYYRLMGLIDGRAPGAHGYDPEHPDMAGIFLAIGRGVPAGASLERAPMTGLAPTAAALLEIEPPSHAAAAPVFEPEPAAEPATR